MVVSAHPAATRAALETLRRGGNATDAAVVAAFVLGVVEPYSSGLGGGGFGLFYDARTQRVTSLDFRERAPGKAHAKMFLNPALRGKKPSRIGALAVGTPGMVAGMAALAKRSGSWPWRRLLEPARRLAQGGFRVFPLYRRAVTWEQAVFRRFPHAMGIFLPGGRIPAPGTLIKQPDLARTLARLQRYGAGEFYRGETARLIAAEMKRQRGILSLEDLRAYRVRWGVPVRGRYRGYDVYSMGSPSSGGVHLIQLLHVLEGFRLAGSALRASKRLHLLAEAMRLAFADRAYYQGDAAVVRVPIRGLLSRGYAARLRRKISPLRATPTGHVKPGSPAAFEGDGKHTSHLGVVDRHGNAASVTLSINTWFGAGLVARGTGVVLNNEMDDFAAQPGKPNAFGLVQSGQNAVAPGKAPLSSMSPTVVLQGGRLRAVLGAAGGPTIITSVLQILLGLLDHRLDARRALAQSRIHHQWRPATLFLERGGDSAAVAPKLRALGHRVIIRKSWGNANLIWIDEAGRLTGAADPRGAGVARGY